MDLSQFRLDGVTLKELGESWPETGIVVTAAVSDENYLDEISLEVEVKPVGVAFSDSPTAAGPGGVTGSVARVTVNGLDPGISYRWQARAIDGTGRASAWVPFGGNPDGDADFTVRANTAPVVTYAGQGPGDGGRLDSRPGASFYSRAGVRCVVHVVDPHEDPCGIEVE